MVVRLCHLPGRSCCLWDPTTYICNTPTYAAYMFLNRNRASVAKAKRPLAILRPEFEEFLYSPIGEFNDETPSSVLSALARQNLDPWEEAAHLAQLPRESAILRLTPMITSATGGSPAAPSPVTAARLLALLPRPDGFKIPSFSMGRGEAPRHSAPIITYLIVGAIILGYWLLAN